MVKAHSGRIYLQKKTRVGGVQEGESQRVLDLERSGEPQDRQAETSYAGMQTHHMWRRSRSLLSSETG